MANRILVRDVGWVRIEPGTKFRFNKEHGRELIGWDSGAVGYWVEVSAVIGVEYIQR